MTPAGLPAIMIHYHHRYLQTIKKSITQIIEKYFNKISNYIRDRKKTQQQKQKLFCKNKKNSKRKHMVKTKRVSQQSITQHHTTPSIITTHQLTFNTHQWYQTSNSKNKNNPPIPHVQTNN